MNASRPKRTAAASDVDQLHCGLLHDNIPSQKYCDNAVFRDNNDIIGVARMILSGVHFFPQKVDNFFSRRPQKTV